MPHLGDSTLKVSGKHNSLDPLWPVIKVHLAPNTIPQKCKLEAVPKAA